ncbi:hypothetical protein Tco_0824833 [Tanacetum coccineum]
MEDVLPWPGNANMSFDLRPTEDVLPWPGNANMAFDLWPAEDVLPWPGNANMAFDLWPMEDVLLSPGNANMAFDLWPTEDVLLSPGNANLAFDLRPTEDDAKDCQDGNKGKDKVDKGEKKGEQYLWYEEVRKKSLREFHKTHRSGSGTVTKIALSTAKIKPSVTNEGTGVKPGVPDVTDEESTERSDQERDSCDDKAQSDSEKGSDSEHETDENESCSESDQKENEEEIEDAEEEEEDKFVKTSSNDTEDEDETKNKDKTEGDEDEGMDSATNQFDDDVNVRINEPVDTDEGLIQKEGTDAEMTNVKEGNENLEITLNQVIEDAHVTLSTIPQKTEDPVTSSSYSSDLASKFLMDVHVHHEQTPTLLTVAILVITDSSPIYSTVIPQSLQSFTPPPPQSTPTPPPTTEATNPLSTLPNFTSVFQFNNRVTTLEKQVSELKRNDPLNTQVTALVDEQLDSRLGALRDKFMSYLSASITARIT